MKKQIRGSLILLLGAMIWGAAFVGQDEGMKYFGPFTFNALRMILAAIALIPAAFVSVKLTGNKDAMHGKNLKRTVIGGILCGFFLFLASATQQLGIKYTASPGKSGFITSLYIILVPLVGLLLKKIPQWTVWPCIAIGTLGLFLICGGMDLNFGKGELMLVLCALFFSFQITCVDNSMKPGIDPVCLSCVQFATCSTLMSIAMVVIEHPTMAEIATGFKSGWFSVLYVGLMSGAVAYTFQILGQRDCPPVAASLIMSLESVFAALFAWIIQNKKMTGIELLGSAIVFAAVIIAQIPVKSRKPEAPAEE